MLLHVSQNASHFSGFVWATFSAQSHRSSFGEFNGYYLAGSRHPRGAQKNVCGLLRKGCVKGTGLVRMNGDGQLLAPLHLAGWEVLCQIALNMMSCWWGEARPT